MRIGTKGRPFYRIVVVDERKKRTGAYVDLIGTYNPLTNPKEIKIDQAKVDQWVKNGAQLSDGFLRITKQNTHIPERKVRNPGKLRSNTPKEEAAEEPQEDTVPVEEVAQDQEAEVIETAETTESSTEETTPEAAAEEAPAPEVTEDAPAEGEEKAD